MLLLHNNAQRFRDGGGNKHFFHNQRFLKLPQRDFFLRKVIFPDQELPFSSTSPGNEPNSPLTMILSTHLLFLCFQQVRCSQLDRELITMQKGIDFP